MAITLDQSLGNNKANLVGGATTIAITTGATAAAGSRIVVCVSWFDNLGRTITCSDGTAYTKDKEFLNTNDKYTIFSRVLVGSLASGSTITVTGSGGLAGILMAACSYLGTTGVDTTAQNATTGSSYSSGSATNAVADALFVGGAGNETATTTTSTPSNGNERFDGWESGSQQGMVMLDLIASSTGAQALTGTWVGATSTATTGALVIYSGTSGAAASPFDQPFIPLMTPQGVTF